MTGLDPESRQRAVDHVLREVHPDRLEGEVVGVAGDGEEYLVGVKALPRGYLSSANYALVTVDGSGSIVNAEAVTGRRLRRELGGEG